MYFSMAIVIEGVSSVGALMSIRNLASSAALLWYFHKLQYVYCFA